MCVFRLVVVMSVPVPAAYYDDTEELCLKMHTHIRNTLSNHCDFTKERASVNLKRTDSTTLSAKTKRAVLSPLRQEQLVNALMFDFFYQLTKKRRATLETYVVTRVLRAYIDEDLCDRVSFLLSQDDWLQPRKMPSLLLKKAEELITTLCDEQLSAPLQN